MQWVLANFDRVLQLAGLHLYQSVVPLILSVLIAVPLAQFARQQPWLRGFIVGASSLLYTIPSLALFIALPLVLGTRILDLINVIVALTIYAVALLVRSTVDALDSVDDGVRQAAVAMGYRPVHRFFAVDLPLSLPVLFAGLRVISVSNISLVTIGALIGIENLGYFFMNGLRRNFATEILTGIVGTLVLAVLMDLILVLLERLLTPWRRAGAPGRRAAAIGQSVPGSMGPDSTAPDSAGPESAGPGSARTGSAGPESTVPIPPDVRRAAG